MDLTDKRALVSGATTLLGQGLAYGLAAAGADVAVSHFGREAAAAALVASLLESGRRAVALEADPTQPEAAAHLVAEAVAALGRLDIAVIVPAEIEPAPFLEQSVADWRRALAANVAAALYLSQAAARQMIAQGRGGRLIFISSVASEMAFHETSLAGTTLAAVNTLAKVAAHELGEHNITVNVVAPGWFAGDAGDELHFAAPLRSSRVPQEAHAAREYVTSAVPLRRLGALAEVGDLCAFLASDAAGYVTGAYIPIDGGYTITKQPGGTPYPGRQPWPNYDAGYDPFNADF